MSTARTTTLPEEKNKQVETMKPLTIEEVKGDIETDLALLEKILTNESLTRDEKNSEISKLKKLKSALSDQKTGSCLAVIKMFDNISQKNWPALFVHFDVEIIHGSFPPDEKFLKLLLSIGKQKSEPQKNTWLSHKVQWENILYGTLVSILNDILSKKDLRVDTAQYSLLILGTAFTISSQHFPELSEKILKKFFLENLPNSIKIFTTLNKEFSGKPDGWKWYCFSRQDINNLIVSWLPADMRERITILVKLLQTDDGGFKLALTAPFVRSKDELVQTVFTFINARTEHIVNLFEKLSPAIAKVLFKNLTQFGGEGFLKLLQTAFTDLSKANLPLPRYVDYAVMLLTYSMGANVDIFKIIDADANKDILLKAFLDIEMWLKSEMPLHPYHLIFSIIYHYQPDQFSKTVFEHIQQNIKKENLYKVCECIIDAKKIMHDKLVFPKSEEARLVEYLKQEMDNSHSLLSQAQIEVMMDFIPNFDKLFLELITKEVNKGHLSRDHKSCLDSLVKIYGFSHINAICLDLRSKECSTYLNETFSKCPDILHQVDEAIKLYENFFDEHEYKIDCGSLWNFYDKLSSEIMKVSKSTTNPEINVTEICAQTGIASELVSLMPSLKIRNFREAARDELKDDYKLEKKS